MSDSRRMHAWSGHSLHAWHEMARMGASGFVMAQVVRTVLAVCLLLQVAMPCTKGSMPILPQAALPPRLDLLPVMPACAQGS